MPKISEDTKNRIKQTVDCRNYLEKSKNGGRGDTSGFICPECKSGTKINKTGAVEYYPDTNSYSCHACGKGGDVIRLYRQIHNADFLTAVKELAERYNIPIEYEGGPEMHQKRPRNDFTPKKGITTATAKNLTESAREPAKDYSEYYKQCAERFLNDKEAQEYWEGRGLSFETAYNFSIGFDPKADPANSNHPTPRVIIPASKDFYTARRIDNNPLYRYANPKGSSPAIFNLKALYAPEVQEIFVTEGAFDALSVIDAGAPALALNSTANADKLIDQIREKRPAATLILSLDNDKAGQDTAEKLKTALQAMNIEYITANICGDQKDANAALKADRKAFERAIQLAKDNAERARQEATRREEERRQRTGAEMVDSFLQTVKSRKYEPIPTGITDIDKAIGGGFIRQQLVLLGAAPALGKTALAQWIFETMAEKGNDCLYLNLEMSKEQMIARSLARITARNGNKVKPTAILQGFKWTQEQEKAVTVAAAEYKTKIAPHIIYNPEGVTAELDSILQYLESEARRSEAARTQTPNIVIDYLQIIRGREREDTTATIKRAVSELKDFAVKYNTVVFLIIAHNRNANTSGIVTQEAGRDTSALEYSADLQLGLTFTDVHKGIKKREDLTPEDEKRRSLVITKARWAEPHSTAQLYFNGETMSFSQIEEKQEQPAPAINWNGSV